MHHKQQEGFGLYAAVSGRVAWQVLNRDGTVAQAGEQSNLILDRGLDQIGTNTGHGSNVVNSYTYFTLWRRYFAVGTGSTAPAVGQTTLAAEALRSDNAGGFGAEMTDTYTVDSTAGTLTGTFVHVRVIDLTASYNLTEFGFSEASGANGLLTIRELFRDGSNNAITLSVQSGQQLKMTHTFSIVLTYKNNVAASFTITNLGLMIGKATWFSTAITSNYRGLFTNVFNPNSSNAYVKIQTATNTGDPTLAGGTHSTVAGDYFAASVGTYTSGTFKRLKTFVIPTSGANIDHYGWTIDTVGNAGAPTSGFKFSLTNPTKITKTSTNKLTLTWEVSWGRA